MAVYQLHTCIWSFTYILAALIDDLFESSFVFDILFRNDCNGPRNIYIEMCKKHFNIHGHYMAVVVCPSIKKEREIDLIGPLA